jgi:NIMA (never in mitosis gene a)-related kinase
MQAKIFEDLLGFEVVQVSCGASHVMAVTNEHDVFAWGRGDNGRLGLGHQDSCCSPQKVPLVPETNRAISALCGVDCSMLLVEPNSTLFCCGSNRLVFIKIITFFPGKILFFCSYNKLALDREEHVEEVHSFTPVQSLPLASQMIRMVALGTSHAAAILRGRSEP